MEHGGRPRRALPLLDQVSAYGLADESHHARNIEIAVAQARAAAALGDAARAHEILVAARARTPLPLGFDRIVGEAPELRGLTR
jgi:hypothetical protein